MGEVIYVPAGLDDSVELFLCSRFQGQDPVFVCNAVHLDVEDHGGSTLFVDAATVIVECVHEVNHRFDRADTILFEFDDAVRRFLTMLLSIVCVIRGGNGFCFYMYLPIAITNGGEKFRLTAYNDLVDFKISALAADNEI